MFTILDRYILRSLLFNYLIALGVMISLYVVLDLFVNMDEFVEDKPNALTLVRNVASYYGPNIFLYFTQLSGVITLFACMSTIARARRYNEMTAILSSGVSLYRVAAPVLLFGLVSTMLLVVNTELLIPRVAHLLSRDRDDVDARHAYEVLFQRDRDNALLSAGRFHPVNRDLQRLLVLVRDDSGAIERTIEADRAAWVPLGDSREHGRWKLERGRETTRILRNHPGLGPQEGEETRLIDWYDSDLSPEEIQLRQRQGWVSFLSLAQLDDLLAAGTPLRDDIIQIKHSRIAAPIVSVVLLLLGLPFFLDRSPANVLNDAGKCMLACGLCYVVTFVAQSIRPETQSALPAWIPIFVFATAAMVMIDRIRT